MILLLHTLIEAAVGFFFLFYPNVGDLVPGFGSSEGESFELLLNMYGLAALFLAALSLITYFSRERRVLFLTTTGMLCAFHLLMAVVQATGNPDSRAMLLHFLLGIFMGGQYIHRRRQEWPEGKFGTLSE